MDLKSMGLDPPKDSSTVKELIDFLIYKKTLVDVIDELYQNQLYFHKQFERLSRFEMQLDDNMEDMNLVKNYLMHGELEDAVEDWLALKSRSSDLLSLFTNLLTVDGVVYNKNENPLNASKHYHCRDIINKNIKKLSVGDLCYLLVSRSNFDREVLEYHSIKRHLDKFYFND